MNLHVDDSQLKAMLTDQHQRRHGFELMVRQYSEQIYWQVRRFVLNHDDADDIVQNAFMKAWNAIDTFHGESKVYTWLSRIAINEAIDFDGDALEAQLQEAIAQLPDVQRNVFLMRYYDEMKYADISRITGTSEGSLKASYHIAVKKITEFFRNRD